MAPNSLPPLLVKVISTFGLLFCWNPWLDFEIALPFMTGGSV